MFEMASERMFVESLKCSKRFDTFDMPNSKNAPIIFELKRAITSANNVNRHSIEKHRIVPEMMWPIENNKIDFDSKNMFPTPSIS